MNKTNKFTQSNILQEVPNTFSYGIEVGSTPVDLSTKHLVKNNFLH